MTQLILAISFNVLMTLALRFSEGKDHKRSSVLLINYLVAILVSLIQVRGQGVLSPFHQAPLVVILAALNGILYITCLFLLQVSIRANGAGITATFNRLGVVIPTLASILIFQELPSGTQVIGLVLALVAILLLNEGEGGKDKSRPLLIVLFIFGGAIDLLSKIFHQAGLSAFEDYYMLYTFVFAFILALVAFIRQGRALKREEALAGVLVGIPNQLCSLLLLKAAAYLPAYFVFPVNSVGIILAVNLVSYLVFKEKLSKREVQATGVIVLALVFLNI